MPTRQTTKSYGLEIFSHTIILSEVYQMEGFSNRIKIERMVSKYFSSCNLEQLKIWLNKSGTDRQTDRQTDTRTRTHTHTHKHSHTCIPTSWTKAMLRKTRHALAERAWFENASIHKKYEQNYYFIQKKYY